MNKPSIRIFGSNDWIPKAGNDGSWYALDGAILIDTGWRGVTRLIDEGADAAQYPLQLFTHLHPDHRLALPQLLMYWRITKGPEGLSGLTIAGPREALTECYENAHKFVFTVPDEANITHCTLRPLAAGDVLETQTHTIASIQSAHGVPGLCYRITNKATGRAIGISGDTAYAPQFADFFRGCDMLVYECTLGDTQSRVAIGHSSVYDAVAVARECGAKKLLLTHCGHDHAAMLRIARAQIGIPISFAEPGVTIDY